MLASRLGVASVLVKHKKERFGLPAFKMLGASWAALRSICGFAQLDFDTQAGFSDVEWLALTRHELRRRPGRNTNEAARFLSEIGSWHTGADAHETRSGSPVNIAQIVARLRANNIDTE